MKCPLMLMGRLAAYPRVNFERGDDDCREEDCAWWDGERCAVLMIAVDLDRAVSQVNDLCLNLVAQLENLNENISRK